MIDLFENTVRIHPDQVFATFVNAAGAEASYTYRQVRLAAAALARRLQAMGVGRGDAVVVDLPNNLEFLLFVLASAYGSFTLVTLNHRLSSAEKHMRLLELEHEGLHVSCTVDKAYVKKLMGRMRSKLRDGDDDFLEAAYADMPHTRVIMGSHQDVVEDTVHFAERAAHLFDPDVRAVIMFTSGTTGKPKAVPFTWRQLVAAATAANRSTAPSDGGLWQAVLPFYHIGGFQVIVRSVVNGTPLRAYVRFDAERVLHDAKIYRATHISVVDRMLQGMLSIDERDGEQPGRLGVYRCILLGGGVLNPQTVRRTLRAGVHVYASYGMTETSSQIANAPITRGFTGGLKLLDGYEARIVDPAEDGYGRLAVRGPGVFDGYLNAKAAFTVDGYFLTGDTAALRNGLLYVKERTDDMFVSGGENIYPAEIAYAIRQAPGVEDAYVFGVSDRRWGRRPVAIVERSRDRGSLSAHDVRRSMEGRLSKITMPDNILMVDELPRRSIGKIDREAAEELYANRLEVEKIVLHYIRLPFRTPFKTAKKTLTHRNLVVVEAIDHAGRVGLGECVAFEDDWYLPETLGDDVRLIRTVLAPALLGQAFLHPREVSAALVATIPGIGMLPMAQSALEMAFWDLYGRIWNRPLWSLVNEEHERLWNAVSQHDEHDGSGGCDAHNAGGYDAGAGGAPPVCSRSELPCAATFRGSQALVRAGAVV